jgi:hypothetical protein
MTFLLVMPNNVYKISMCDGDATVRALGEKPP